jgi:nucleoside 2-deoxyribosyltransferase
MEKIAHFLWVFDDNAEKNLEIAIRSFMQYNQEYKIQIWTKDNFFNEFKNEIEQLNEVLDMCKFRVQKIDIFKYLILKKYGGLYIDADTITIGKMNFDDYSYVIGYELLRNKLYEHFTHCHKPMHAIQNNMIYTKKEHPILLELLKRIRDKNFGNYNIDNRLVFYKLHEEVVVNAMKHDKSINCFDADYFAPFQYYNTINNNLLSKNSKMIHLYAGKKDYNVKKYDFYIASGWFNENQMNDLINIKLILNSINAKYYSPKDECEIKQDANIEMQQKIFYANLTAIRCSKCLIVNTRDKDIGTLFEAGYAYANNIPIIYCNFANIKKFNIMLARSGIAAIQDYDSLKDVANKFLQNNELKMQYEGVVE